MKTTVDITDRLLLEAKDAARERGVSLKELIEQGLRWVVKEHRQPKAPFKLKDGSVPGQGIAEDKSWTEIRRMVYEGRGE